MNIQVIEMTGGDFTIPEQKSLNLGAQTLQQFLLEADISARASILRKSTQAEKIYLLSWTGHTRVPRGANVGGWEIGYTRDGEVKNQENKPIGYYERILDTIGEPPQNTMIVFITKLKPEEPLP